MSIGLYKENPVKRPNGLARFFPKHTTDLVGQRRIDAVYYPFVIYENIIDFKKIEVNKLKKRYTSAEDLMEDVYKKIPSTLCKRYRAHLKKTQPALHKKPLILLNHLDMVGEYNLAANIIQLRTSSHRANQGSLELIMPPLINESTWSGPCKDIQPKIGFQGSVTTHESRARLIKYFEGVDGLTTNFFHFQPIFGHISNAQQKEALKVSFIENMRQQIFAFTPRGVGNYSVRFYEALREGRIPVLLDTGTVFPCEDVIDWNDFIICESTQEALVHKIFDWTHNRDLIALQKRCREIWESHIKFSSFIEHVPHYIQKLLC